MVWLIAIVTVVGVVLLYNKRSCAATVPTESGEMPKTTTTGGGCGCSITNNPATWPSGDAIWNICQAIARQEGAAIAGSKPDRYNNPGDITDSVCGYSHDAEGLTIFPNKAEGWNALYNKWLNIMNGNSAVYKPFDSWYVIGSHWAADPNWPNAVCSMLGVNPNTTPEQYVAGICCTASGFCGGGGCCG